METMGASLVGWVMSGIVLLLLFATILILKNPVRLLATGERARGVVVGMDTTVSEGLAESPDDAASSAAGPLRSPLVEFVTRAGERVRVSGRSYSRTPSVRVGDAVSVAYDRARPESAQLMLMKEFAPGGYMLAFTGLILLIWMAFVLGSGDPTTGDPLHILSTVAVHLRLNPARFPMIVVVSLAIVVSSVGTVTWTRHGLDLRAHGITAVGHVVELRRETRPLNSSSGVNQKWVTGVFPVIEYEDASGVEHTFRGSTAKPLSRLNPGDAVEVIYLARRPETAVLNNWAELYLAPLLMGLFLIGFAAWLILLLRGVVRL